MPTSDHALAETLAGLASRLDDLVHGTTGDDSRRCEEQQERLEKLTLAAIAAHIDATNARYRTAVDSVQAAIDEIDAADRKLENIARVITIVAKAADVAEKLLEKAAG
jgi:ABC-type transporter Mla subunit MlaD